MIEPNAEAADVENMKGARPLRSSVVDMLSLRFHGGGMDMGDKQLGVRLEFKDRFRWKMGTGAWR